MPIPFLFSALQWQRQESSLSWQLLFKDLSLKFFQTSQGLHAPGQEDPPGKQACKSESSLSFGSSLIKELVLFFEIVQRSRPNGVINSTQFICESGFNFQTPLRRMTRNRTRKVLGWFTCVTH